MRFSQNRILAAPFIRHRVITGTTLKFNRYAFRLLEFHWARAVGRAEYRKLLGGVERETIRGPNSAPNRMQGCGLEQVTACLSTSMSECVASLIQARESCGQNTLRAIPLRESVSLIAEKVAGNAEREGLGELHLQRLKPIATERPCEAHHGRLADWTPRPRAAMVKPVKPVGIRKVISPTLRSSDYAGEHEREAFEDRARRTLHSGPGHPPPAGPRPYALRESLSPLLAPYRQPSLSSTARPGHAPLGLRYPRCRGCMIAIPATARRRTIKLPHTTRHARYS
ncbi:hypothetical protein FQR65_LT19164 [Abscondita terminalis]|nr:hypothetical protein FQR65_LT19164 [Abscondita terminalis]